MMRLVGRYKWTGAYLGLVAIGLLSLWGIR